MLNIDVILFFIGIFLKKKEGLTAEMKYFTKWKNNIMYV